MSHPAFFLQNGNLVYDPKKADLCTDGPNVCYAPCPVPVPAPTGGGGSTSVSGGPRGWFLPDPVFGKILHIQERIEVAPYVKLLYDKDLKKKPSCPPQRKSVPKTKEELFDLRICVRELRKRIKALELERDQALQGNIQAGHLAEDLKLELKNALIRIFELEQDLARLESEQETFHFPVALPWFVASGVLGLATTFLVEGLPILKFLGYSGSFILAAIGIGSAFSRWRPEPGALPPAQVSTLLPIGVIRF